MLTLLQILGKKNRQWFVVDTTDVTIGEVINQYGELHVKVFNSADERVKQVNLRNMLMTQPATPSTLVVDYITGYTSALGGSYVTTEWRDPDRKKYVVYKNAWDFGLHPVLINSTVGVLLSNESYVPDIKLTADGDQLTDIAEIERSCLFTVNGRVMPSVVEDNSIVLKGATRQLELYQHRFISVISFANVGMIAKTPVTDLNPTLYKTIVEGDTPKAFVFKIRTPVVAFNRDALMVINGTLMCFTNYSLLDPEFITVTIPVEMMLTQLAGKLASDVTWIDAATTTNDGYDITSIRPVEYIRSNSWVITILQEGICMDTQYLHRTGFINTYTFPAQPVGLLYHRDGTMGEYQTVWSNDTGVELRANTCPINGDLRSVANCTSGTNNSGVAFVSDTTDAVLKTLYIL